MSGKRKSPQEVADWKRFEDYDVAAILETTK